MATCLLLLLLALGCDGVGSGGTFNPARTTGAFRSLRLGQTVDPNSPVATTAAINNGEAVVLLNRAPGSDTLQHLLYVTEESAVVRITFDETNLPVSAETADTLVAFSGFTATTVDITLTPKGGTPGQAVTVPFESDVVKLLPEVTNIDRLTRELESEEVLRRLFQTAVVAIRAFGCAGLIAAGQQPASPTFVQTATSACGSLIVQVIRAVLAEGTFTERLVEGLQEVPECDFRVEGWLNDFNLAVECALEVQDELVQIAVSVAPELTAVINPDPTPTATPLPDAPGDDDPDDPQPPAPPTLNCEFNALRCANGQRVCEEDACNGVRDCSDGSDETPALCTPQVLCCIASNGCPGETGAACAPTCCCCGANTMCSSAPFLDGCVASPARTEDALFDHPLNKFLELIE